MYRATCKLVGIFLYFFYYFVHLRKIYTHREAFAKPYGRYTCHTGIYTHIYLPNHNNLDNIPLNKMIKNFQHLLTWSMLSGINSPSLLILVNDPLRATWCNSSGMYPGGGELCSLLAGPQRRKLYDFINIRMDQFLF